MINPIDRNIGSKPSTTYPTYYIANKSPMHEMMPMNPSITWSDRLETLPTLPQYISPYLPLSSSKEEEDETKFVVVKQEEKEEGEKVENEDEKPRATRKRKFYINQTSKQRDADLSYHCKKMDVKRKLEQYRF